LDSLLL